MGFAGITISSGGSFKSPWVYSDEYCGAVLDAGILSAFFGICPGLSSTASRSTSKQELLYSVAKAPARSWHAFVDAFFAFLAAILVGDSVFPCLVMITFVVFG